MKSLLFILQIAILTATASVCAQPSNDREPITLDELMIGVARDSSREVAYTNKQAGVLYTETNGEHSSAWQGWRIMSTEVMEDYSIAIDGHRLDKREATAEVYPHQLVRKYPYGIQETVTLLDSINAIVIELRGAKGPDLTLRSYFSDSPNADDYIVEIEQNVVLIARKRHLERTEAENYPVWIGMSLANSNSRMQNEPDTVGRSFSPVSVQSPITNRQSTLIIVAADTKEQTIALTHRVSTEYSDLIAIRKARMEGLLNRSYVRTDNPRFDKALNWSKLSLDALIMNQRGIGIFAGLPWFDNYWGRDTFISLPALLVTGDFEYAKEILQSFAEWQEKDSTSTNFGRIPNLVTNNSIAYNTADGTPRFIIALDEYVKYSGDTAFAREMYPVVKRSIDGTIKYHTDSLGFLTHGDAETWMDAVGPDGPWSPRGNRANDVQALWDTQLMVGSHLAGLMGDSENASEWNSIATKVRNNFQTYFIDSVRGLVYDHLRSDGTPNLQLRPNQLFAYDLIEDVSVQDSMFKTVTEKLVYSYGVASLSQDDSNFHPYHHYSPYYVQDAAYHNGVVWTWLAGKWIDIATKYGENDLSSQVVENMVHQILDRGAVGTISELLDAIPRAGELEPRLSGTFSQAWSLAEFIRSCYQSYHGCKIEERESTGVIKQNAFQDLHLATPYLRPGLKALQGPSYRLLTNTEIKQTDSLATIFFDVHDPEGDDSGPTGTYLYPQTVNLKPGSLDATHFTVRADEKDVYFRLTFRNLSDPGWHPEYGFQLTYVAIAIDKDSKEGLGQTHVGMNANYTFSGNFAFEDIIYVGGGVRVVNDSGRTLAVYIPTEGDEKNPLGSVRSKTIEFSIPTNILGTPTKRWRFALFVGAQDDHGGAGIGEFRNVESEAKEWIGGGKKNPADPNVYDVVLPPDDR